LGLFISPIRILLSIIFLFLFSTFIEASQSEGVRVNLTSNKGRYMPGESMSLRVRVVNEGSEPVRLNFGTSQRFEILVQDRQGRVIWRWSNGKFFAQVFGKEVLKPSGGELIYRVTVEGRFFPGIYQLKAIIPAVGRSMSAATTVNIR
jgi:uncharacterized protein (DUF58 family)